MEALPSKALPRHYLQDLCQLLSRLWQVRVSRIKQIKKYPALVLRGTKCLRYSQQGQEYTNNL